MCGIVGVVGAMPTRDTLNNMTDALAHRGPDGRGTWFSASKPAAFGHRRLAIIDLSEHGRQPMILPSSGLVLVYNGEIYNASELRRVLEAAGHQFRGHCDSEILLHSFAHWGLDCLSRISGMFAFAVFDERRGRLFLARDRCGQKPLYYARRGRELAFASEIKALHQWSFKLNSIDSNALQEYLAYGYTLGPETLTSGVKKVMPGQILRYDLAEQALTAQTFRPLPSTFIGAGLSTRAVEERAEYLLEESVRQHLVSDVPVGILLSGGIDSSLVTAMAARVRSNVKTFSVSFPGQGRFDEAYHARTVAKYFDTDHTELEMERFGPDILTYLAEQFDEPIADHSIVPTYLLSRRIRESVTVALGGDGGDELFGGYPHYGVIMRQAALRRRLPGFARALVGRVSAAMLEPGTRGRNHLIGLAGPIENAIAHVNLYFDASLRSALLGTRISCAPERRKIARVQRIKNGPIENAMYSDFSTTMPEGYLAKVDRASMLASLEIRAPLLGDSMVDFSWGEVESKLKYDGLDDKILLRRLATKLLPTDVAIKRKQGFTMPLGQWIQSGSSNCLHDILLNSSQDIFNRKIIERLFSLQAKGLNNGARLFSLAMIALWADRYGMTLSEK